MHWRLFHVSDKWFTAADLYDERADRCVELTLTIEKVTRGEIVGEKGRKSKKPALYFKERQPDSNQPYKPLGLCVANSESVSAIAGSDHPRDWVGHRVTLYVRDIDMKTEKGPVKRPAVRIKAPNGRAQQSKPQQPERRAVQQPEPRKSDPAPTLPLDGPADVPPPTDEDDRLDRAAAEWKGPQR